RGARAEPGRPRCPVGAATRHHAAEAARGFLRHRAPRPGAHLSPRRGRQHVSLPRPQAEAPRLYARAGVLGVWIVNRRADAVEVFRRVSTTGYREQDTRRRGQPLAPSAFPDLLLSVDDILG